MNLKSLHQSLQTEVDQYQIKSAVQLRQAQSLADKRLYAIFLIETYHYVKHSSRHQALVAARFEDMDLQYRNYCLVHAREELGHEQMALQDLNSLGFKLMAQSLPEPLSSTKQFIDYLYNVSSQGNPLSRLGYTFWAEQAYSFIQPIFSLLDNELKVSKKSMSFFTNHAQIDEKHFRDVSEIIERFAKKTEDWNAIELCMRQSFSLKTKIIEQVLQEFLELKIGKKSRYEFLNSYQFINEIVENEVESANGNP